MKKWLMAVLVALIYCLGPKVFAQQVSTPADEQGTTTRHSHMDEAEKIGYLINYVRNLDGAIFIRNGVEYSPGEAADHLQSKWDKHKKRVKTADVFIDRLASYSKTNKPYLIRFSDGNTIQCGELLSRELKRIDI